MKISRKEYKRHQNRRRWQIIDRFFEVFLIVLAIIGAGWWVYLSILEWIWSN